MNYWRTTVSLSFISYNLGAGATIHQIVRSGRVQAGSRPGVEENAVELAPGVWLTGPVPRNYPERNYPERNYPGSGRMVTPEGVREDTAAEDASLVFDTNEGLVVLSDCGHAGLLIRSNAQARSSATPDTRRDRRLASVSIG